MSHVKRIFAILFCLMMLLPVVSAAVVPTMLEPFAARSTCVHPDSDFNFVYYQDVYQTKSTDCPGSYITFKVYQCSACGALRYYDWETDFSNRKTHIYTDDDDIYCNHCGMNRVNGRFPGEEGY